MYPKDDMKKGRIDIRKHGFLKVPRMAFMALYNEVEEELSHCANVYLHLLFKACFIPKREVCGQETVRLERGELLSNKKELARRLKLSRQRLDRLLDRLINSDLLEMEPHPRYTIFKIVGYNEICGDWKPLSAEREKKREQARRSVALSDTQPDTKKRDSFTGERMKKFSEWKRQHNQNNTDKK